MKKQLIALSLVVVVFAAQGSSYYERMKAAARGGYDKAKGFVVQNAPSLQEYAQKNIVPIAQRVAEEQLIYDNTKVDDLVKGVPYGNEIVDKLRDAYMARFYPSYTKNVFTDEDGKKIVQWSDASKAGEVTE